MAIKKVEPDVLKDDCVHFPIGTCYACKKLLATHVILTYRVKNNTLGIVSYLLLCGPCYVDYTEMSGLISF